jgi:ribosome-associated protein
MQSRKLLYSLNEDFSCCKWRTALSSLDGAAAAGKAALRLVADSDDDHSPNTIPGAFAGLTPAEIGRKILSLIVEQLDDDKAEDVVTIDLAGKSDIADFMVVASGRSQRHVGAMADKVVARLKAAGVTGANVEGSGACDWVLIDAHDVIVHLFRPEVRSFYNIERVWSKAAHASVKTEA